MATTEKELSNQSLSYFEAQEAQLRADAARIEARSRALHNTAKRARESVTNYEMWPEWPE